MAMTTTQTNLLARLGDKGRKAFEVHKSDAITLGSNAKLPAGIENGVAQLYDAHFAEFKDGDNKGQLYFIAQATVISPDKHNGIKVSGLQTRIRPIPLCDTPKATRRKTQEQNVAYMIQYLGALGLDTKKLNWENLETAVAALKRAKPFFRFRTWQGAATEQYPNPQVNEEWGTVIADYKHEINPAAGVSAAPPSTNGTALKDASLTDSEPAHGNADGLMEAPAEEEEVVVNEEGTEEVETPEMTEEERQAAFAELPDDLDELVALAKEENGVAQDKLAYIADQNGCGDEARAVDQWEEAAQLIRDKMSEAEGGETGEPEEKGPPTKGEVCQYYPQVLNSKTGKYGRASKPVEIVVQTVDSAKQTVTVTNNDTKKPVNGANKKPLPIKWSDLIRD